MRTERFGLSCAPSGDYEVCSGSTGGIADNDFPNSYNFDGLAVARKNR
jgi:hypothetical protein